MSSLKDWLGKDSCDGCHIHFAGCETFAGQDNELESLMEFTKATSVSGYAAKKIDWVGWNNPGVVAELQLLGSLKLHANIARNDKYRPTNLVKIREDIQKRFDDCDFKMLIRPHKNL